MLKVQLYCFTTLRGESYAAFFEGEPPVSYEELSASGSYLLYHGEGLPSLETEQVELKVDKTSFLTDEEYEALPEKEKEHANLNSLYDGNMGELTIFCYTYNEEHSITLPVTASVDIPDSEKDLYSGSYCLFGTLDEYEKTAVDYYGEASSYDHFVCCSMTDTVHYQEIQDFLKDNGLEKVGDLASHRMGMQALFLIIRICGWLVTGLITLIAIVNMVNIISIGMLNESRNLLPCNVLV